MFYKWPLVARFSGASTVCELTVSKNRMQALERSCVFGCGGVDRQEHFTSCPCIRYAMLIFNARVCTAFNVCEIPPYFDLGDWICLDGNEANEHDLILHTFAEGLLHAHATARTSGRGDAMLVFSSWQARIKATAFARQPFLERSIALLPNAASS